MPLQLVNLLLFERVRLRVSTQMCGVPHKSGTQAHRESTNQMMNLGYRLENLS
jgi:hypothetical protein